MRWACRVGVPGECAGRAGWVRWVGAASGCVQAFTLRRIIFEQAVCPATGAAQDTLCYLEIHFMNFFFTWSALMLSSSLLIVRPNSPSEPFRDYLGLLILLFGFGHLVVFLASGRFLALLPEQWLLAVLRLALWVLLMVCSFVLAYPLLEKHVLSDNRELLEQGRQVLAGFEGIRRILGFFGLAVCLVWLLLRLGVFSLPFLRAAPVLR
jgi:hypothetical protein